MQVLDHVTRMQVARYRSRIPIHDLPILLVLIGLYYNEAWLAVEKNALGVGVVDALAKDYRYRYLYRHRRPGDDPQRGRRGPKGGVGDDDPHQAAVRADVRGGAQERGSRAPGHRDRAGVHDLRGG